MAYFQVITLSILSLSTLLLLLLFILNLRNRTLKYHPELERLIKQVDNFQTLQIEHAALIKLFLQQNLHEFKENLQKETQTQQQSFHKQQIDSLKLIQDTIQTHMQDLRHQIMLTLTNQSEHLSKRVENLTEENNKRLKEISGQVEQRLNEGFEKTTATFADVVKRLALIDAAQKKITELSSNVVSLQEVLADKRSRGAFGEVQLSALIKNVLPESNFRKSVV